MQGFLDTTLRQIPSFSPPFLLRNGITQTMFAGIRASAELPELYQEIVLAPDGGELFLDWTVKEPSHSKRLLILIPGVTGSAQSNYIRSLIQLSATSAKPWDAVVMTFRGLAGSALKTPRITCGADREDLACLMRRILERSPADCTRVAIGFSMGANLLVNYLGMHQPPSSELRAAMSISNPFDFPASSRRLHSTVAGRTISSLLARGMKNFLRSNLGMFDRREAKLERQATEEGDATHRELEADKQTQQCPVDIDVQAAFDAKNVQEFDTIVTSRVMGFDSLHHYYSEASCVPSIPRVTTPLFVLSSLDDPFVCADAFPRQLLQENSNVAVLELECGGHVAFMDTLSRTGPSWAERLCVALANEIHK